MQTLSCSMWDLVLQPEIEPRLPPLGDQSLAAGPPGKFPEPLSNSSHFFWGQRGYPFGLSQVSWIVGKIGPGQYSAPSL